MSLKAKLVTSISAFALVLALLIVGVLAVPSATINMGGSISFTATDVNATVAIDVEGTVSNDTSDDKTYTFDADTKSAPEAWTGKKWTFDDTRTITVTVTVTNKDTVRSLTSTFTAPAAVTSNLACATTEDSKSITAGAATSGTPVAPGEDVVYVMTFTIEDANLAVNNAAWTAALTLANA